MGGRATDCSPVGPIPKSEYLFRGADARAVGDDGEESKWHCTALYCSPAVRGKGVGRRLVNARIACAQAESTTTRVRVRVLVHPQNPQVRAPLKARGFADVGTCAAVEAIPASGDDMLLPADGGAGHPEVFHERHVSVMELEISKS